MRKEQEMAFEAAAKIIASMAQGQTIMEETMDDIGDNFQVLYDRLLKIADGQ